MDFRHSCDFQGSGDVRICRKLGWSEHALGAIGLGAPGRRDILWSKSVQEMPPFRNDVKALAAFQSAPPSKPRNGHGPGMMAGRCPAELGPAGAHTFVIFWDPQNTRKQ